MAKRKTTPSTEARSATPDPRRQISDLQGRVIRVQNLCETVKRAATSDLHDNPDYPTLGAMEIAVDELADIAETLSGMEIAGVTP